MGTAADTFFAIGVVLVVVGFGMFVNRWVSRTRFGNAPQIIRFVEPMSRIGLLAFLIGVVLVGIAAALHPFA